MKTKQPAKKVIKEAIVFLGVEVEESTYHWLKGIAGAETRSLGSVVRQKLSQLRKAEQNGATS